MFLLFGEWRSIYAIYRLEEPLLQKQERAFTAVVLDGPKQVIYIL